MPFPKSWLRHALEVDIAKEYAGGEHFLSEIDWWGMTYYLPGQFHEFCTLQWSSLRGISILLEGIWPAPLEGL